MSNFKTIDEARAYFSGDRFATENGMTLEERDESHAVTSLALGARHRNALGGVMGGAIFTLADFAFAALTNDRERVAVAQQVSVNFLAAAKGDRLIATAFLHPWDDGEGLKTVEAQADGEQPRPGQTWGLFDDAGLMVAGHDDQGLVGIADSFDQRRKLHNHFILQISCLRLGELIKIPFLLKEDIGDHDGHTIQKDRCLLRISDYLPKVSVTFISSPFRIPPLLMNTNTLLHVIIKRYGRC